MSESITAPLLLAKSSGIDLQCGRYGCFYCGGSCDGTYSARQYVADSFTERNAVVSPGSECVCRGCVEAMRSDLGSVPLIDGGIHRSKEGGKRKPKEGAAGTIQVRWFSWLLTETEALAATPSHRTLLLAACLAPPSPPFAICIADGNKHQLFRTPVNHSRERIAVNCEGARVHYHPDELRERLHVTTRLIATVGKGAESIGRLMDPNSDMGVAVQLSIGDPEALPLFEQWREVRNEPLSALSIWLSPGKDEARGTIHHASPVESI